MSSRDDKNMEPRDDCAITDLAAATLAIECVLHKHRRNSGKWRAEAPIEHVVDHALAHIRQYVSGDRSEPHLEHAATRLLMALQLELERANGGK
jgi:hypothetical protein